MHFSFFFLFSSFTYEVFLITPFFIILLSLFFRSFALVLLSGLHPLQVVASSLPALLCSSAAVQQCCSAAFRNAACSTLMNSGMLHAFYFFKMLNLLNLKNCKSLYLLVKLLIYADLHLIKMLAPEHLNYLMKYVLY